MTDDEKKQLEELETKLTVNKDRQKALIAFVIIIMVFTFIAGVVNNSIIALWVWLVELPLLLLAIIIPAGIIGKIEKKLVPYREMYANEQAALEREKLNNIKKTVIVETHTSKDKGEVTDRGVTGALLFGAAGAVVGTASAGDKTITTFLIVYNDDNRETRAVENGSELYNHYIKFLEV